MGRRPGHEPLLSQSLGVQTAGLFFNRAERPTDSYRRQFMVAVVPGNVQIAHRGDPVPVLERHFAVVDFIALGEGFIPVVTIETGALGFSVSA